MALPIGGRAGLQGRAVPDDGLLFASVDVRIGLKISWYVLGIGTLFGVVEWRSAVAHDAVRLRVERLRGDSVRELIGAVDMLSALKDNQLAARELLARTGGEQPARASAEPAAAIEDGLVAFEQQLAALRRATEAGLATLAQAGNDPVAARDREQIATWLDRINSEVAVHRSLVGELRELRELARSDPEAARKYLDDAVYPHYERVLEPLIQASRLFQESESRIHSTALIHEQLCRSGDHTRIDFRDYVDGLTRNVLSSAGEAARPVNVKLDVDPVPLDLNVAIACGLILDELLSNALKYAFPDGRSGTITVTFRCADGSATLVVADDGVGLPAAPSGGELPTSLGFRLVAALVRQLHGVSSVEADGGTRFTLTFRIDGEPPAVAAQA
jgi:two-component sensor histidine kinase